MRAGPVVVLLMLAACGSSTPPAADDRDAATRPPPPTEAPAPAPAPPRAQGSAMEAAESFPGTFRGRWALVPADCEPGRPDAKGLMTVTADGLTFYESRATITAASPTPTDGVAVSLAFTGEGQSWTTHSVFELSDHGRSLLRTDRDPPLKLRYTRCPA